MYYLTTFFIFLFLSHVIEVLISLVKFYFMYFIFAIVMNLVISAKKKLTGMREHNKSNSWMCSHHW